MSITSLCNCGGPSPEGYHEPHCLENGITQSLDRDHPHWSFNCPQCPYESPFKHANELAARAAFQGHLQGCAGRNELVRADGYTEEQIKRWCQCGTTYATYEGPVIECPLHGGYVVEWVAFTREIGTLVEEPFEPRGVSYTSDEYTDESNPLAEALDRAENELDSIRRYDERPTIAEALGTAPRARRPEREYQLRYRLRYRLIGNWTEPRA